MNRRTVVASALLATLVGVMAGCSSSSHAKAPRATTSTRAATSTRASTTTIASTTTSTATPTTSPPRTVPPTTPTTSSTTPIPPAPGAPSAATHFFAAWLTHDSTGLSTYGTADARNAAVAQYSQTSGASWQFSNCQGAAGSEYCTWVRAAQDVVLRISNVSNPNLVASFQLNALAALDIAGQFVTAWEFDRSGALGALGTAQAVSQIQAQSAHRHDAWQQPSRCDGTAGSFYCTFTAGSHTLIVRVGDVEVPHLVQEVRYTP